MCSIFQIDGILSKNIYEKGKDNLKKEVRLSEFLSRIGTGSDVGLPGRIVGKN